MGVTKVATCCYCGTKAALVLRGKTRHELSCSQCGAPLRALKMLRADVGQVAEPVASVARPDHRPKPKTPKHKRGFAARKRSKAKRLFGKVVSEIWDEIEDIFD